MATQKDVDVALFTGDFTQAGLTSQAQVDATIAYDSAQLRKLVPSVKKVFFSVGNHDAFPGDVFPFPFPSLYEQLVKDWGQSLDDRARQMVLHGGYYSTPAGDGLQIISLNSLYLFTLNPLVKNQSSAAYHEGFVQMDWFEVELAAAEKRGDKVWVLGHIPFSDGVVEAHLIRYLGLVEKYKNTITGQFFGHDHHDYFRVTRACGGSNTTCQGEPTGVMFAGPSLTEGWSPMNPGLRTYLYDNATFNIQDAVTYYVDLNESNKLGKLEMKFEYSFVKEYGLSEFSPAAVAGLVDRLNTSAPLFATFYQNYFKRYTGPSLPDCTSLKCRTALVCKLAALTPADLARCGGSLESLAPAEHCHPHGAAAKANSPRCVNQMAASDLGKNEGAVWL